MTHNILKFQIYQSEEKIEVSKTINPKFLYFINMETQLKKSRRCDSCYIDVHRTSRVKHLKSKKHLENEK